MSDRERGRTEATARPHIPEPPEAWPGRVQAYDGPIGDAVRAVSAAEGERVVRFLATEAVEEPTAPHPASAAEGDRMVCPLATEAVEEPAAPHPATEPVVSPASDAPDQPGPDLLGLPAEGDVAGVLRALVDGELVVLLAGVAQPLPPSRAGAEGACTIRVTDRVVEPAEREVVLRPPSLVVGVGASRGACVEEILGLVEGVLGEAGLSPVSLAELATVDAKSDEPGIVGAAARLGVPLVTYSAERLAGVEVPNPSEVAGAAVGAPSVAEAAALARGGELLVPKRKSGRPDGQPARATCAVVRRPVDGWLTAAGVASGAGRLVPVPAGVASGAGRLVPMSAGDAAPSGHAAQTGQAGHAEGDEHAEHAEHSEDAEDAGQTEHTRHTRHTERAQGGLPGASDREKERWPRHGTHPHAR
ncbi:cobalamin biosynthesis protein [Streptomyces sp. M41]|uniref:cobalamin biosynthesis protein n=1 Tax=Streptomyces sp. M41 TaxID=3059412 RepID=UPI00374D22BD